VKARHVVLRCCQPRISMPHDVVKLSVTNNHYLRFNQHHSEHRTFRDTPRSWLTRT
jgi:hypothetical protein